FYKTLENIQKNERDIRIEDYNVTHELMCSNLSL
ncbi:unnamed protein product, partial [Allacma fusca]